MSQLLHIIKYKFLVFIRLNTKINLETILKNTAAFIIYGGFAFGAFLFTQSIIHFLLVKIKIGLFLLHEFISMVLFIFFISVNVGNIIVSYSTLYKSGEVNFLFTKPIQPSKVFTIKFLDNFFYSSSTLVMILISVIAGYAVYFNIDLITSLTLIIFGFVPFILTAGSLGAIILLVIIKLASKFGAKKVIYSLICSYLLVVFTFFKLQSPVKLVNEVMKYYPILDKDKYMGDLLPSFLKFFPNNWLSESAYWIVQKNYYEATTYILLQLTFSIILFSTALYLGKKWYKETWLQHFAILNKLAERKRNNSAFFSFRSKTLLKPKTESIIKKEFWTFVRETSQVLHFLILTFLIIIFMFSIKGMKYIGIGNHQLQTMIYLSVFLFILLLISTLSLRFVFPLISLEGETFWKIKSAPVTNSFLIFRKIIPFGFIILIISQGLSFFANYGFNSALILTASVITLFASTTIFLINFGMGGLFANYKEKNAIRLSSSQGASLAFLANVVYMLFIISVLFEPVRGYFYSSTTNSIFNTQALYTSILPIAVVSIIISSVFINYSFKSLNKDFSC